MEVHHHPEVGKKSFKEYLLEGLMIFIAVTMGFFAESLREHINHGSKEKDYAVSFAEDLRLDTSRTNNTVSTNIYNLVRMDTLQTLLLSRSFTQAGIVEAYKLLDRTQDPRVVIFSERTYNQLRGAGEAGLISSREVSNAIEDYELGVKSCQALYTYYDAQMLDMAANAKKIFRPQYRFEAARRYWTITDTAVTIDDAYVHMMDSLAARAPLTFATTDPKVFDDYCSDLGFYQEIVVSYIRAIEQQKKSAVALLALLQKEYDLDVTPPAPDR